jgi:hypothetical protein
MLIAAVACEATNAGNVCDSEREPRHPVRLGSGNNSSESGIAEAGAGIIALMFITWAMRL